MFGASLSLEVVGVESFCETEIEHIQIPNRVRELGDRCFYRCVKLCYVGLSVFSSLERIGAEAFYCVGVGGLSELLREFYLPDSVRELGPRCFAGCRHLKRLRFGSCPSLVSTGTDAFTGTPLDGVCLEGNLKFRCLRPLHHKR